MKIWKVDFNCANFTSTFPLKFAAWWMGRPPSASVCLIASGLDSNTVCTTCSVMKVKRNGTGRNRTGCDVAGEYLAINCPFYQQMNLTAVVSNPGATDKQIFLDITFTSQYKTFKLMHAQLSPPGKNFVQPSATANNLRNSF